MVIKNTLVTRRKGIEVYILYTHNFNQNKLNEIINNTFLFFWKKKAAVRIVIEHYIK